MDFFATFCIVSAFLAGFGTAFVWQWQVKRTALSITNAQAGEKGRAARKEQESELMTLIGEVSMEFKKAKEQGEPMKDAAARILPAAAARHPTAAMKLGGKLFKKIGDGGLGSLEDLFG